MAAIHAGKKRPRDDVETDEGGTRSEKKARPTSIDSGIWPQDSVISTPTARHYGTSQAKYDSDDQSSMVSEPGSPQDISMSSDDDEMHDDFDASALSQSPESTFASPPSAIRARSSPWHSRTSQSQNQRVATPMNPNHHARPGTRPIQLRTSVPAPGSHHKRDRHPQENLSTSSETLSVPSPIDEDEVPTPPSAAEAAGSQLSMLTVNDMDTSADPSTASTLPAINISTDGGAGGFGDSAIDVESMDDADGAQGGDFVPSLALRKPRQRSGAVSSPSPVRAGDGARGAFRGFSMGWRADCEKCRMRVPGHMNHFVGA